jgi:hypothetical protein
MGRRRRTAQEARRRGVALSSRVEAAVAPASRSPSKVTVAKLARVGGLKSYHYGQVAHSDGEAKHDRRRFRNESS